MRERTDSLYLGTSEVDWLKPVLFCVLILQDECLNVKPVSRFIAVIMLAINCVRRNISVSFTAESPVPKCLKRCLEHSRYSVSIS